jgi:hypothetical protein
MRRELYGCSFRQEHRSTQSPETRLPPSADLAWPGAACWSLQIGGDARHPQQGLMT